MKVYTKTGDKGTTSLYHPNKRVTKCDPRIDAVGAVDELNSYLGLAIEHLRLSGAPMIEIRYDLEIVQRQLFKVGTNIATPDQPSIPLVDEMWIGSMEKTIDVITDRLPTLDKFIIPSGGMVSCHFHVARSICRRAEREVVRLKMEEDTCDFDVTIKYLNRLSDMLFTIARATTHCDVFVE